MLKNAFIVGFLLLIGQLVFAQQDSVYRAAKYIQNGQLDLAKNAIDAARQHPETSANPYMWYLRGFIYKEIYKKQDRNNRISNLRIIAFESFEQSIKFDTINEYSDDNKSNLKYIGNTFYNDAAESLHKETYEHAITSFNYFKKARNIIDPSYDTKVKEIEFKLALATLFEHIYYENRNENEKYFQMQEKLYSEILDLDPDNSSANKNFGLLYYNKAVFVIKELDYDIDFEELMKMQDGFVALFKQGLPYVEKAYELNPNSKEIAKALEGIYFSLNELDKSNEIKKKLESFEEK